MFPVALIGLQAVVACAKQIRDAARAQQIGHGIDKLPVKVDIKHSGIQRWTIGQDRKSFFQGANRSDDLPAFFLQGLGHFHSHEKFVLYDQDATGLLTRRDNMRKIVSICGLPVIRGRQLSCDTNAIRAPAQIKRAA